MKSIGIRELRQNASRYLRMVREGESIEVTDRGEPIAMITPIKKSETALERLIREGRATPPRVPGGIAGIKRVTPKPGEPSPGEILDANREDRI